MPSEKVIKILLSKSDKTRDEIDMMSESEAWAFVYSSKGDKPKKDVRRQICFTGFGESKKQELSKLAFDNGYQVVGTVTVNLDLLCCGENAGPKKIEKAKESDVYIIDEDRFLNLIHTGGNNENI